MRSRKLARRYAVALGELAHEQGVLDEVRRELESFQQVLDSEPNFRRVLEGESVSVDEKCALLREAFGDRFSRLTMNFLLLVVSKRRESALSDMIEEFFAYADEIRGVVQVELTTAKPLAKEQADAIAGRLCQVLGKEVRLSTQEDEDLIGGIIARIGNLVMDGSVKTRLRLLGERLKKAQLN